ncbi:potassium channel family protein [Winogradskyella sp. UBA3174]|uniref:potassium channel family protein n=1 Tax=Winogradskyella sp. UBA3174 TaxID=1947785 RepID=UPI0025FECB24|nr:potassium channel family protein [Winogradskyella sp. UBA3174]|tara:strand:+ start:3078 stop:3518 length:441 start_codon:yes stop_codon:yes gene_type:complete
MIIKIIVIGAVIIAFNLLIQGLGNVFWLRKVARITKNENDITNNKILRILLFSFLLFTLIHTFHSLVWAFCYYIIPETASQFSSLSEAVYFSMVTFTTLGYGDISLTSEWRLLSGLEAINGIMLIGWSTAMMFSLIQNIYKKINDN